MKDARAQKDQESDFDSQQVFQRIQKTISRKEGRVRTLRLFYRAAAAVLLLGAMAGLFSYYYTTYRTADTAMVEKKAAPGTLARLVLPDGTEVWLNAGSQLRFPKKFNKDKREVVLEGEAFFNVRHDKKKPFLIHTKDMVTQVLGTSFNVSSYPQDSQIKVTVVSGKVAVYEKKRSGQTKPIRPVFLTANQQVVYTKKQKTFSLNKKELKPVDAIAWKEGNLVFKDTELAEVVRRLERRYAIQIEMDSTMRCPVTVNFNNEPLDRVMRVLAQLVNGQVSTKDGHYELKGVLCQ